MDAATSGLEQRLAELESLGVARPAHVLFTEYMDALIAEQVLDVATADQLSAAYNRVRYAAAPLDDASVGEATDSLAQITTALAAKSIEERRQLTQRLQARFQVEPNEPTSSQRTNPSSGAGAQPTTQNGQPRLESILAGRPADLRDLTGLDNFTATAQGMEIPMPPKHRRRAGLPRVSLEIVALVSLATFFVGYLYRDVVNKAARRSTSDSSQSLFGLDDGNARHVWKDPQLWVNNVRLRGREEVRTKKFERARLAYELVLAYSDSDVRVLNDLAWLYLMPEEGGKPNPHRALSLANKALDHTRSPVVLDTAAEAYFQCGCVSEAIRLEQESLNEASEFLQHESPGFREFRRKQLDKFRAASARPTASSGP